MLFFTILMRNLKICYIWIIGWNITFCISWFDRYSGREEKMNKCGTLLVIYRKVDSLLEVVLLKPENGLYFTILPLLNMEVEGLFQVQCV